MDRVKGSKITRSTLKVELPEFSWNNNKNELIFLLPHW
jgi:hypothetical protein